MLRHLTYVLMTFLTFAAFAQDYERLSPELIERAAKAPIQSIDAKKRPVKGKLHDSLRQLAQTYRLDQASAKQVQARHDFIVEAERVLVEVRTDRAISKRMFDDGFHEVRHNPAPGYYEMWVSIEQLEALEQNPMVHNIRPARKVQLLAGASNTQGVAQSLANSWHTAGFDGTGVTLANIDGGYSGYLARRATGDFPTAAQSTLFDYDGGGFGTNGVTHGTSTVEINYDMAPGATYLIYETLTVADWIAAINHATANGADVISVSLGAPLDGIGDGTALPGSVAEACENARNQGVLVVNAAGNERDNHWGGLYAPSAAPQFLDWDGLGAQVNVMPFCIPTGTPFTATMYWDDWTNVDHDYDLHLYEFNGTNWILRASSTFTQNGGAGQTPQEFIQYTVAAPFGIAGCGAGFGVFGLAVERISAASNRNLQVFGPFGLTTAVEARSLAFPADSPAVMTVAAIDAGTLAQESYSSEGPVLSIGGGLGATTIEKPDITAYANVDTESDGAAGFNGTSAATPHVAGAAALVLEAFTSYSGYPDAVQEFLENCAIDLGPVGQDTDHGAGRLVMCDGDFDTWTRDNSGDVGIEPYTAGSIWHSPDVKLCNTQNCASSQPVHFGQTNWVYVTLRNTGPYATAPSQPAAGTLHVYYSGSGGASQWPTDWTLVDAVDVQLASNEVREIEIEWNSVPAVGHYCLLTRWVSADDPMTFVEVAQTTTNVENNNNISWKNFNVQNLGGGGNGGGNGGGIIGGFAADFDFQIRNIGELARDNEVRFEMDPLFLEAGGRVIFDVEPLPWRALIEKGRMEGIRIANEGVLVLESPKASITLPMEGNARIPLGIRLEMRNVLPKEGDLIPLNFNVVQFLDGKDVGGVANQVLVRGLDRDTDGDGEVDIRDKDDDNDGVLDGEDQDPVNPKVGHIAPARFEIDFKDGYHNLHGSKLIEILEEKGEDLVIKINMINNGYFQADVNAQFNGKIDGTLLELFEESSEAQVVVETTEVGLRSNGGQMILREGQPTANASIFLSVNENATSWKLPGKTHSFEGNEAFTLQDGSLILTLNRGKNNDGTGIERVVIDLHPKN